MTDRIICHMRLYQRPNGFYYIEVGRGKARSLKTKDPLLAQKIFKKTEKAALENRLIRKDWSKLIPLSSFQNEYVTDREGTQAENTIRIDRESFTKFQAFLGDHIPIRSITRKQCDEFVSHLRKDRHLKPTTINIAIRHLKAAFKKAVEWEYLDKSPLEYVKQVVIKDSLPRALSESEVARLLNVIEDTRVKELILTYLYTGGRRTEIVRLQWQDFREDAGQWRIHIRETKTKVRIIPLADNLKQILFQRKKDIGPLFPYYYGRPKEASKTFRRYADMAKLGYFKLHDLRHTAATFMILHGVSMKIVSEILGHASIKTTEIYTKLIAVHLRDGINTLSF